MGTVSAVTERGDGNRDSSTAPSSGKASSSNEKVAPTTAEEEAAKVEAANLAVRAMGEASASAVARGCIEQAVLTLRRRLLVRDTLLATVFIIGTILWLFM